MDSALDRVKASPAKRALLLQALRGRAGNAPSIPRRAPDAGDAPLSFAQERVWFLEQLDPGAATYNLPNAVRIQGPLNAAVLQRALDEVVRRHEALRTVFPSVEGRPVQRVLPHTGLALPMEDLSALPPDAREAALRERVLAESQRPFDLPAGPVFRPALLRLGDDDHALLLMMHHIAGDAWSNGVLFREMAALYEAFAAGRPSPLPELPIQFADFAAWQRSTLDDAEAERLLDLWRERLRGAPVLLDLPADRPRPAVRGSAGGAHRFRLSSEVSDGLRAVARREGATLFHVLLALWSVLLSRHTGQDDLLVGTPLAGRTRRETEGLIGFFVNTRVVRARLQDDPPFAALVRRLSETMQDTDDHPELPFERLVDALVPERELSHTPLIQSVFVLQNVPTAATAFAGLTLHNLPADSDTAKFDLSLVMMEGPDGISGMLEYAADLFDPATAARIAGRFAVLARGAAAAPGVRASALPLLDAEERRAVLQSWNPEPVPVPALRGIHQLFEAEARRAPDAPALRFGAERMTYGQLDAHANGIAHRLRALGAGPETRVALCLERAPEMIAAVLGVLKAGSAYVPLDPAYPAARLEYMLRDSGAEVLVTRAGLPPFATDGIRTLFLDDAALDQTCPIPCSRFPVPCSSALAYVIYTSGSTGLPKGVMVPHRGLPNLARAYQSAFGLGPGDRVLQFASLSFDAAAAEWIMALGSGAELCLGTRDEILPGADLARLLDRDEITVVTLPPSALAAMEPGRFPALRTIAVAGEACPAEVVDRWAPGRRFFNLYGPTEATIWSTAARCEPGAGRPAIGRAVPGARAYVLDGRMQPVPLGVAGELYVGGAGVTRGYHGRPALTAERFVPDPFGGEPGARLYRTGDRARWKECESANVFESGDTPALTHSRTPALEFLGRTDAQVKVRGFRIEPGEVEAALTADAAVRECAVVARADAGEARLVAYVVAAAGAEPSVTALRAAARERLPEHMVPSRFVFLDDLPRTPGGKVDRRALPAPDQSRPRLADAPTPPRNEAEQALAEACAEVLGVAEVGVHDNFFALGGDSILSIRLVARAASAGLRVTPRQLFRHQSVAELAAVAERIAPENGVPVDDVAPLAMAVPGIAMADVEDAYPLTPYQRWCLHHYLRADDPGTYLVVADLRITGREVDPHAFAGAWQAVVDALPVMRSSFVWEGRDEPVQVVRRAATVTVRAEDWRHGTADEQEAWLLERMAREYETGLDPAGAPQVRAGLYRLGETAYDVVWTFNHMFQDGWSFPHVLETFFEAYEAILGGRRPAPRPRRAYRDVVAWINARDLTPAERFWRRTLAGFRRATPVADRPLPAARGRVEVEKAALQLSREESEALERLAREHRVTLHTLFAGAWALVLARNAGVDDVVFGSVVFGRPAEMAGVEEVAGTCLNFLPLRVAVPPDAPLPQWLRGVQANEADLREHEYAPLMDVHAWSELPPGETLFESYLVFEKFPMPEPVLEARREWGMTIIGRGVARTAMPLRVELMPGAAMLVRIHYERDRFAPGTPERLMA
ncbi:MAG: amino acid adenylation domain-containing protein, partial [Gemmatimonadetes bacterium]|nr:amino acid adenylation domain-containing protein [Gemmatimonadota bacterium]